MGLTTEERRALPPLTAILAFEAIGTHGGIRKAAAALARDHAALSRQLRDLQDWAGVALVEPGSGRLTEQGARFHARLTMALKDVLDASQDLTRRDDERKLRLWVAPGLASQWMAPRLASFAAEHPDIDLEIHPTHEFPDFAKHEADAVVRFVPDGSAEQSSTAQLRSINIARPEVVAVSSPQLLAQMGWVRKPEDLLQANLLHEMDYSRWHGWFAAHGIDAGAVLKGPRLWHGDLTVAAAKRAEGIALSNSLLINDALRSGCLQPVCAKPAVHLGTYTFSARSNRWRSFAISHFRRWLQNNLNLNQAAMELV